eukprot:587213-Heterocapsa_arctica.AAC.1
MREHVQRGLLAYALTERDHARVPVLVELVVGQVAAGRRSLGAPLEGGLGEPMLRDPARALRRAGCRSLLQ